MSLFYALIVWSSPCRTLREFCLTVYLKTLKNSFNSLCVSCFSDVVETKKKEKKKRPENGRSAALCLYFTVYRCLNVYWPDVVSLSSADSSCCRFGVNDPPHGCRVCFTDQHEVQEEEETRCRSVVSYMENVPLLVPETLGRLGPRSRHWHRASAVEQHLLN